ncbi:MAG: hypothetical protein U0R26_02835 [Solirubrobacterales bacterium]
MDLLHNRYSGEGRSGTLFTLIRLKADGSRDSRFGHGGSIKFGLKSAAAPHASSTASGGALYLSGAACCFTDSPG